MDAESICPACRRPVPAGAPQGLCPECLMKAGLGSGVEIGMATTDSARGEARGKSFVPPTVEQLAQFFPQLEVLEFIGRGGMGAVYKARQKQLDRVVALKILPPGSGDEPAFADRFAREAKAMAKLAHPGIVTIHDFGRADGLFYFVMEFVDGVTLRQLLDSGRVSPREALAIVPQICDALQYAHDAGIVHRDIKPENILLDRQGRVKVADFGLAKLVGTGAERAQRGGAAPGPTALTEAGKVMGTPPYMAPEQRQWPEEVDHRADIYSLGVVFYQLLTGELPGRPIEPPSKRVQIDVRLDEVVLKALEEKPQRRYQQASALKTEVESIAATSPTPHPARQQSPSAPEAAVQSARSAQATAPRRGRALGGVPWQIWVVVVLLALEGVLGNLPAIPTNPVAAYWLAAKCLFVLGLLKGWRWVFILFLVIGVIHVVALPVAAFPNLVLVILTAWAWRWYFPTRPEHLSEAPAPGPRAEQQGAASGGMALPVAGVFFLLPPAAFIWFLLGGHWMLGVDLGTGMPFIMGFLGLPVSVGVGAMLAWAVLILSSWTRSGRDEVSSAAPRRWCWQATASVVFLAVSLPLGGGALGLLGLLAQNVEMLKEWNPDAAELGMLLWPFGGAFFTAAPATLLAIEALRRIGRASGPGGGRLGAMAAAWFWPVMVAVTAVSIPLGELGRQREQKAAAEERVREETARAKAAYPYYDPYALPQDLHNRYARAQDPKTDAVRAEDPPPDDVADIRAQHLTVEGNSKMRYFLIGPRENAVPPKSGFTLVVVMPGGDGGAGFHPFVRRLFKYAMNEQFLVAQPVAVRWNPSQQIVWPTKINPEKGQEFATEDFVEAVVKDVGRRHPIDKRFVFTLAWSSGGPAAYAIALQDATAVTGSYIAMSVYRPDWHPPVHQAKGRVFLIDHSPQDKTCPFSHAERAQRELTSAGAKVRLVTYEGGHGWHGANYPRVREGLSWLVEQSITRKE